MNEEVYIKRLIQSAEYLEKIESPEENKLACAEFIQLHEGYRFTYNVLYHKWILMYLSDLFPEFFLDEVGDVCYNLGGKDVDGITGVYILFGISEPEELFAFLEAEETDFSEKYGTRILGKFSTAKDIAYNMRKVAEFRMNKLFDL